MSPTCIVLDSNVLTKLFLQEELHDDAKALIQELVRRKTPIYCPDIFLYEVLSIAAQNSFPVSDALGLLRNFERANLTLKPLTAGQLQLAIRITEDGHPKSGFPSIYDSSYHAIAISKQGLFITADQRHIRKTEKYGHIAHLSDWPRYLSTESNRDV
ncbi:MAG: type II toxin-antitoxin system VapC family toxin [Pseudomonadota bacterium]